MTSYTMNGHSHPTMQIQPEILMGIVGNQAARFTRAQWRMKTQREKFECLGSPEPQVQHQEALQQIEALLRRNLLLMETVFLLSQALSDAHALIQKDAAIGQLDRNKLSLSQDFHGYMERLREEIRTQMLN